DFPGRQPASRARARAGTAHLLPQRDAAFLLRVAALHLPDGATLLPDVPAEHHRGEWPDGDRVRRAPPDPFDDHELPLALALSPFVWGEIYESVLALYILRPTLATLINPKRGKFNVTEKGGLLPRDYFDYKIVRPHLIILGLLVVAVIIGFVRWLLSGLQDSEVLVLNVAWALFNLLTIGAAIAVGRETRQLRSSVRLGLELPSVIYLPDGQSVVTRSRNLSTTGGMFAAPRPSGVGPDDIVQIEFPVGDR